ncbi:MAG: tRNA pseudouridine(38-40) synthase TruA [Alphaproteobacteria bacterium]|nr:tRNA pseudouridine(38-40) synthase TruA [Alphaproteobacteria bacterium]
MRYKMVLAYHGEQFSGWQRQDNAPSVQAAVETALSNIDGRAVSVIAAGRTDSGVHAVGQVISFDLNRPMHPDKLLLAINFHLRPQNVAAMTCQLVPPDFHARFNATGRDYRYRLLIRVAPPVLERGQVWHHPRLLDISTMQDGAAFLVGHHDFSSFRAAQCQATSPIRTLTLAQVMAVEDEIHFLFSARSFLHHQVRNMVGTLVLVGRGIMTPADIKTILTAKDRNQAGPTAPAQGLCLMAVHYDRAEQADAKKIITNNGESANE